MNKQAAIIGGGVIGGGWAARFLLNGWDVNLYDPAPEAERKIEAVLKNARYALPMLYEKCLPQEGKLKFFKSLNEAVENVQWIQESVPERLDIKHGIFAEILKAAPKDAVIASSTSGFKPSQLQEGLPSPKQILVAHPFNPVYLLPVVEVVPSPKTDSKITKTAMDILSQIGMHPVHIKAEIDAHIADRLLEALWREALWLVNDNIATTQEIDDIIRYGFGLRWAQMGLFETYRVAGGEAGMRHFMAQFGPCLKWPWTKLMDVPEFSDELVDKITKQSDEQSGHYSIRELEHLRDKNLIAIMRALKGQNSAVGNIINAHEKANRKNKQALPADDFSKPLHLITRTIPCDWVDYNGHMNESRYGQVYSDTADEVLLALGADENYVNSGYSYFTVDIEIKFLQEIMAGSNIDVRTKILQAEGKKLRLFHEILNQDGEILSTGEQMLIHVDLNSRRACEPQEKLANVLKTISVMDKNS